MASKEQLVSVAGVPIYRVLRLLGVKVDMRTVGEPYLEFTFPDKSDYILKLDLLGLEEYHLMEPLCKEFCLRFQHFNCAYSSSKNFFEALGGREYMQLLEPPPIQKLDFSEALAYLTGDEAPAAVVEAKSGVEIRTLQKLDPDCVVDDEKMLVYLSPLKFVALQEKLRSFMAGLPFIKKDQYQALLEELQKDPGMLKKDADDKKQSASKSNVVISTVLAGGYKPLATTSTGKTLYLHPDPPPGLENNKPSDAGVPVHVLARAVELHHMFYGFGKDPTKIGQYSREDGNKDSFGFLREEYEVYIGVIEQPAVKRRFTECLRKVINMPLPELLVLIRSNVLAMGAFSKLSDEQIWLLSVGIFHRKRSQLKCIKLDHNNCRFSYLQ